MSKRAATKAADRFEDNRITAVERDGDGWAITADSGWSLWLRDEYGGRAHGLTPKAGDTIRVYGEGIGHPFRGLDLNGAEAFYQTPDEQRAEWKRDQQQRDERDRAEFEAHREEYDRRIAALPAVFWSRFERFRRNRPDFRWKAERYELFCCEQGLVIAAQVATWGEAERLKLIAALPDDEVDALLKVAGTEPEPLSLLRLFRAVPFEEQLACVPGLSDGHSGNTFGFSCRLASLWLTQPALIEFEHGALCVLEGCEGYGCRPFSAEEQARLDALTNEAP